MPGPGATDRSKPVYQSKEGKKAAAEIEVLQAKIRAMEEEAKMAKESGFQERTYSSAEMDAMEDAEKNPGRARDLGKFVGDLGKGPVAVKKTQDRDSLDYPDAGGFQFGASAPGGDGVVRRGGGPTYVPGGRERAVEGNTRAQAQTYGGEVDAPAGAGEGADSLEMRLAEARARLKASGGGAAGGGRAGR